MKLLLIFATCCLAVHALGIEKNDSRIHGENGWYVPQKNNTFEWMTIEEYESYHQGIESARGLTLTPVQYYLYTRENPRKGKQITDSAKSIQKSNFNPANPTKFIVHGFLQGYLSSMNKEIRKALLGKEDCNVVVTDWARARSVEYISSVAAVPKVGAKVAHMIETLVLHGMSLDKTTIIGHSLGAHVAGMAAKNIKSGQVSIIYGLDPALPLFHYNNPATRLNSEDAKYVETIQTNGGTFGFLQPIGKSSFYPNGGKSQPGCLTAICSHERSISYFAESVTRNSFAAIQCESLESAVSTKCGETYSSVQMGADKNPLTVSGIYNVPVNKKSPFGMLH